MHNPKSVVSGENVLLCSGASRPDRCRIAFTRHETIVRKNRIDDERNIFTA